MKKVFLAILFFSTIVFGGEWQKFSYNYDNFNLPYQLYIPENITSPIPLVIYLHGTGSAGIDNEKQMYTGTNIGPQYFSSPENQKLQKAYILAPQTPMEIRWASTSIAEYDFKTTPITPSMNTLLALIDKLITELKVDTKRIYIAGLSRGGQGVWNAALHRPELFAAIVPIAGSSSPKDAYLLKDIPVWIFHGNSDTVTNIEVSEHMFNELAKYGNVKYTIIKNGEHSSSWLEAHRTQELWKWLLQQNK